MSTSYPTFNPLDHSTAGLTILRIDSRVAVTRGLETRVLALKFTQTLEPDFSKLGAPLQKLNIDLESGKRQLSNDICHVVYLQTLCEPFPSKRYVFVVKSSFISKHDMKIKQFF